MLLGVTKTILLFWRHLVMNAICTGYTSLGLTRLEILTVLLDSTVYLVTSINAGLLFSML